MRETALEGMRRQARWLVRISVLLLAPGLLTLFVGVLSMFDETALSRWCAEWSVILVIAGGSCAAMVQLWARWFAFRCDACRFRLSRAGAGVPVFLFPKPVIRFCPHCGVDLARTP